MVKEALACGLPVVSVDVGDVRETIGAVPGCVVTRDATPETLSRALAEVLGGPGKLDVTPASDRLDQKEQARRVVEIYERVLRRGASRGAVGPA
jgi:glycosyltransferase involved in cell wall biosynthesis